jgi:hypothetical protein
VEKSWQKDLEGATPLPEPMLKCFDHLEVVVLSGTAARSRRKEIEKLNIEAWEMPIPAHLRCGSTRKTRRRLFGYSASAESDSTREREYGHLSLAHFGATMGQALLGAEVAVEPTV